MTVQDRILGQVTTSRGKLTFPSYELQCHCCEGRGLCDGAGGGAKRHCTASSDLSRERQAPVPLCFTCFSHPLMFLSVPCAVSSPPPRLSLLVERQRRVWNLSLRRGRYRITKCDVECARPIPEERVKNLGSQHCLGHFR